MVRGRLWVPVALVLAVLIALPVAALTESGLERDVKDTLGIGEGDCAAPVNIASAWVEAPSLDEPRDEPRAVTLGGDVYLVGGTLGIVGIGDERHRLVASDRLTRFDPHTGTYEDLAPLPQALNHVALAAYRGDLYVAGGYGELTDANTRGTFYRYDPESDRWSRLPDMPAPRAAGAVGVLGDRLIYAGGARDSIAKSDVFAYDFDDGRWSRLPSMHTRREHVGAAVAGGRLYVLGGRAPASLAVDTAERFNPAKAEWERLPPMPVPSGGLAATEIGAKVVAVAGGNDGAETVTGAVQEFNPATDEWARLPDLRIARHGHGTAVAGGRIWVFGGSDCAYFHATDRVEALPAAEAG